MLRWRSASSRTRRVAPMSRNATPFAIVIAVLVVGSTASAATKVVIAPQPVCVTAAPTSTFGCWIAHTASNSTAMTK